MVFIAIAGHRESPAAPPTRPPLHPQDNCYTVCPVVGVVKEADILYSHFAIAALQYLGVNIARLHC
ncbi:hypothetical protein [Microcoleus sp. FACHB-831]|uniref:hypothetical protein n=1 Tax=Microcoleus sp. FACHB-831 TaxID=2692827 RepID=UPI0016868EA4|nr:hypothetical protein [Microcoleus sp. FACHB-831]